MKTIRGKLKNILATHLVMTDAGIFHFSTLSFGFELVFKTGELKRENVYQIVTTNHKLKKLI